MACLSWMGGWSDQPTCEPTDAPIPDDDDDDDDEGDDDDDDDALFCMHLK